MRCSLGRHYPTFENSLDSGEPSTTLRHPTEHKEWVVIGKAHKYGVLDRDRLLLPPRTRVKPQTLHSFWWNPKSLFFSVIPVPGLLYSPGTSGGLDRGRLLLPPCTRVNPQMNSFGFHYFFRSTPPNCFPVYVFLPFPRVTLPPRPCTLPCHSKSQILNAPWSPYTPLMT